MESRLQDYMDQVRRIDPPSGRGIETAIAKGGRMRRRNQAIGVLGGLAVAAVVWFVAASIPKIADEVGGTGAAAEPSQGVSAVPSQLEWSVGAGTIGSWATNTAVWGDDGFIYALSTAPGLRDLPAGQPPAYAVYRSSDGLEWSNEILAGLGDDLWAKDLAQSAGHLYVVGTAPSLSDPGGVGMRVGVSGDAGSTWKAVDLALESQPPADDPRAFAHREVQLASGPSGVLAAASTSYSVDYTHLVPQGLLTQSSFVQRTADGLALYDFAAMDLIARQCENGNQGACRQLSGQRFEPTLRWTGTWAEIGVEPPADSFVELFYSADGIEFDRVESPFQVDRTLHELALGSDGFYAITGPGSGGVFVGVPLEIWRSSDGRSWSRVEGGPGIEQVIALGAVKDRTVLAGLAGGRLVVGSVDAGSAWEIYDLSEVLPVAGPEGQWVNAAGVGPAGLIFAVQTMIPAGLDQMRDVTQIVETADLESWSSTPASLIVDGYVDQLLVGDSFLFLNATSGAPQGRVHAVATRAG
jgi:hypothetical protein